MLENAIRKVKLNFIHHFSIIIHFFFYLINHVSYFSCRKFLDWVGLSYDSFSFSFISKVYQIKTKLATDTI